MQIKISSLLIVVLLVMLAGSTKLEAQDTDTQAQDQETDTEPVQEDTQSTVDTDTQDDLPPMSAGQKAMWTLTGVACVAAITGSVFTIAALSEKKINESHPAEKFEDRQKSRTVAGVVSFSVAGAAAIAALIILLTTDEEHAQSNTKVTVGPGGASLVISF